MNINVNSNLKEELSLKLLQRLTINLPELEINIQKQLSIKHMIDEIIDNYEVNSKCTALVKGDLEEKVGLYIANKKLEGYSIETLKGYIYFFRKFADRVNKPVSTITTVDLRIYLSEETKDNAATTANNKIEKIKAFFQWLQDEEYIMANPAKKLKGIKTPKRLRDGLNIEQVLRLNEACRDHRERAIFEFFCSTGCRVSEVANLKLDHINWSEKSVRIIGKGDKERIVLFDERCKFALELYIKNQRKSETDYLFVATKKPFNGMRPKSFQTIIHNIQYRAGIMQSVFPHRLRHTFATLSVNRGVNVVALQQLMGHESPDTTQRYFRISMDTLKNEYKKISF
ncbi:MAG: site-specific tyrosine recombinase/integron integrase [Peptostreptococcaceae bacterium]